MPPFLRRSPSSFEKKLAAYSTGAAALLAVQPALGQTCGAPGALVGQYCYTDISDQVLSGLGSDYNIDLDNNGTPEVWILMGTSSAVTAASLNNSARMSVAGNYLNVFNSGTTASVANPDPGAQVCIMSFVGNWQNQSDKYGRFQFQIGGQTHQAWARFSVSGMCDQITIHDYAYNTIANDPIPTGFGSLPVELASFTALADGRAVVLAWETLSETNNAGFELQRLDGAAWQPLGFVEGQGTTLEAYRYSHRLEDLAPGTHRFRLKQVDFDGTFDYSPEVEAHVALSDSYLLSEPVPNPSQGRAAFMLEVARTQAVRVAVYDMLGRRVATLHEGRLEAGQRHRLAMDEPGLVSGAYVVRVEGEAFYDTRMITIVR